MAARPYRAQSVNLVAAGVLDFLFQLRPHRSREPPRDKFWSTWQLGLSKILEEEKTELAARIFWENKVAWITAELSGNSLF